MTGKVRGSHPSLPMDSESVEVVPLSIGAKVRQLRRANHWTQRFVANALGISSQGYISDIEAGKKTPTIEQVVAFAELFQVTTDFLLRDVGTPKKE